MKKEILNFIKTNLSDVQIDTITPLNEGLFAQTWEINGEFIAKVSKKKTINEYQNAEGMVLEYLSEKIRFVIPKVIKHSILENEREILIETKVPGKTFSYEEYLRLPDKIKRSILIQYGRICNLIHSINCPEIPGRLKRTARYQIEYFHNWYTKEIRGKLTAIERSVIENALSTYESAANDVKLLPSHADLHFNNIMVNDSCQEITGIIDFGAFQYADPAYEFRYMYGEPQKSLETGYGKQFDKTFLDRQFFYCICMFLMGAAQPELSWVSSKQNVKRLKKLIACRHMEEAYR